MSTVPSMMRTQEFAPMETSEWRERERGGGEKGREEEEGEMVWREESMRVVVAMETE